MHKMHYNIPFQTTELEKFGLDPSQTPPFLHAKPHNNTVYECTPTVNILYPYGSDR